MMIVVRHIGIYEGRGIRRTRLTLVDPKCVNISETTTRLAFIRGLHAECLEMYPAAN